jgi:nucleoside phosphorylase
MGGLLVFQTGMGPARVQAALPAIEQTAPQEIWLVGVCGALVADLQPGDLVISDATWIPNPTDNELERVPHCPSEQVVTCLQEIAQNHPHQTAIGPILTSDHVLVTAREKRAAGATGALAVEMEAGPLARWVRERRVPFVHLRVVLDPLDAPARGWPGHASAARRTVDRMAAALTCPGGPLDTRA